MTNTNETLPRQLTPKEVALLVRTLREAHQWTQATLAEIAKVTERTVQRVEAGDPSDLHTRRALATALGCEDPDAFNRKMAIPTEDEARRLKEEFERDHLILDAAEMKTGRQLATLFESGTMDMSTPTDDMPEKAARDFAVLLDYLRDYRDIADEYGEVQKLDVYAEVQQYIDAISAAEFLIMAATRRAKLVGEQWENKTPWEVNLVYLTTAAKGREQLKMAVPRRVQL